MVTEGMVDVQRLQGDVAVFFGWEGFAFGAQCCEGSGDVGAGLCGADDGVDVAALGGVGVGEGVLVLGGALGADRLGVGGGGEFAAVEV